MLATIAVAKEKKPKAQPGPYVFTSKASAQTLKPLIVQDNLKEGYTLDSDNQFQLRFSKPAQDASLGHTLYDSKCVYGNDKKKVWSYTFVELNGMTTVTVQPVWSIRATTAIRRPATGFGTNQSKSLRSRRC